MNKNQLMTTAKTSLNKMNLTLNKTSFKIKKASPEIMAIAGAVGVVTSAVMACVATTKVSEIIEDNKSQMDVVHDSSEKGEIYTDEGLIPYTEEDKRKDTVIIYAQTGLKLAKLYGPSIILGALSLTSLLASNNILRKRNAALGAAYAAIDSAFKDYRKGVIDRFGDEVDKELKYHITTQKVEKTEVDEKTGKTKTTKEEVKVSELDNYSQYAKFFDEYSTYWQKNAEYNLMFLKAQESFATDKLRSQGYLFLNDVYDALDIPRTKAGQIVGWTYEPDNPNHRGDDFVDFGLYDTNKRNCKEFVNGYERTFIIDPNVDGPILDMIDNI